MRKDVKLGLAVGGVLLAVLVVYVLVVPGNNGNQVGATLETLDGSESVGGAANGGAESSGGSGATASRGETMGDDAATAAGTAAQDRQARGEGGASADAGATRRPGEDANRGASTNDRATGESAGGGWNWDALVNGTEKLPSLGAGTDVSTNETSVGLANGGGAVGSGASGNGASYDNVSTATGNDTSTAATGAGTIANGNATASDAATLADTTPADATAMGSSQSPARQYTVGAQPTSIAPEPLTASTRTHVVKVGDTYSSISAAAYGSSKYFAHIEHANPGIDPTRLKPGMTITLPAIATKPAAAPGAVAQQQTLDPRTQYKVQPNDSLYTISLRLYGKADRVDKIYELNKSTIGDDMARVKVGTVLKLPEPPTQGTVAATAR